MRNEDAPVRSLEKTITWRVIATCITLAVAYFYTGDFGGSLALTLTAAFLSMIAYYVHERVWSHIHAKRKRTR